MVWIELTELLLIENTVNEKDPLDFWALVKRGVKTSINPAHISRIWPYPYRWNRNPEVTDSFTGAMISFDSVVDIIWKGYSEKELAILLKEFGENHPIPKERVRKHQHRMLVEESYDDVKLLLKVVDLESVIHKEWKYEGEDKPHVVTCLPHQELDLKMLHPPMEIDGKQLMFEDHRVDWRMESSGCFFIPQTKS